MTISEFDLRLYGLLKRCFRGGFVSPLRDQPDATMYDGLRRGLTSALVGRRCACRDDICRTFWTANPPPRDAKLYAIRFHVAGELTVTCDARGTIAKVEYLADDPARISETTCYALTPAGWALAPLADA